MTTANNTATPTTVTAPAMSAADVNAAVAAALSADRARQSGIRTCEDAKGREKLVDHLANNTELTVDAAKAILAAAPKEAAETATRQPASGFAGAMDRTQNPNVKPDGEGDGQLNNDADSPQARAGRLMGAWRSATGAKVIDLKPAA